MANGLQIAASALIAQQWRLDSVANDIANVNTVGYRQTRASFTELMSADGGVLATTAGTTKAQAPLTPSDNPLSIALTGPGYLLVTTAAGTDALTRNGNLRIDGARNLVLDGGERLKPPVKIPAEVADDAISIGPDGTVSTAGRALGKLSLVNVPASNALEDLGGGMFATTTASGAASPTRTATVQQGVIEGSNVDLAVAMTEMLEAQRSFSLASRAIHTQDQLLEIANGIRR